jgi:hypothetical protein
MQWSCQQGVFTIPRYAVHDAQCGTLRRLPMRVYVRAHPQNGIANLDDGIPAANGWRVAVAQRDVTQRDRAAYGRP